MRKFDAYQSTHTVMHKTLFKVATFLIIFSTFIVSHVSAQSPAARYPLIPYPQELKAREGSFIINHQTGIIADAAVLENEITQLKELFPAMSLPGNKAKAGNSIHLQLDAAFEYDEGYTLDITAKKIILKAKTQTGIFRGIETLRQLAPSGIESNKNLRTVAIPAVYIKDFPVYHYRGMHLDVSRHFFTLDYLKKFIDRLALYKFNKFHLHLTDDQGWRIEIKKYPLLTEKGAWRKLNSQDRDCIQRAKETGNQDMELDPRLLKVVNGDTIYGGFYTQQQMKSIVQYAKERHIDIIPEIDMPGHMNIAVQLYPHLACGDTEWKPGGFSVPLCPCNEQTFEFAENVYKEIFEIFPYEFVHLGADEVNKDSWKKAAACRVLMDKEILKDVDELQSYFVHRMEKFFNANGRKLIGWDEILEGGVNPTAYVMYWRSWVPKAPVEAAKNGNRVIMTPGNPLYFDAIPDKNSLYNVYHFNPVPKGLTEQEATNIIGVQANIWTEWIPSEARLEYMSLPRQLALSEVVWTHRQNWKDFRNRLAHQQKRLETMGTKYRLPDIEGLLEDNVFTKSTVLNIKPPAADLTLRYTIDGSLPHNKSAVLNKPVVITKPVTYTIAAFTKDGLRGDIYKAAYRQQDPIASLTERAGKGIAVKMYKSVLKKVAEMDAKEPDAAWMQDDISVIASKVKGTDVFGLQFNGYIHVPADGIYSFFLTSDDGSVLKIADQVVVDNDGLHSPIEKSGQIVLKKGYHKFELRFIEGGGGYTLDLQMKAPGDKERRPVPVAWLK